MMRNLLWLGMLLVSVSACGLFDEKETTLKGERIAILSDVGKLSASASLTDEAMTLPEPETPANWPQNGGNALHLSNHVAVASSLTRELSVQAGEGNDWPSSLIAAPVISDKAVFALDAGGYVSAYTRDTLNNRIWIAATTVDDDTDFIGGGLAYADGKVFVTLASGDVVALDAKTGKPLWKRSLNTPIRSAPSVEKNTVFVITVDSQLFALDAQKGDLRWRHRGIQETSTLLGTVIPAVDAEGERVIAAYPSGEIYALALRDGAVLWSDSLILPQRTSALGTFTGVGGDPIIADGYVYTVSQNGLLAANDISNGLRIWEQPVPSQSTPWVAGDYLFVVSKNRQVACIVRQDGRIRWVSDLPETDEPERLTGPYLISDRLVVFGSGGDYYAFNPKNGKASGARSFHSGAMSAAAFAGGTMYYTDQDATLHAIQ